MVVLVSIILLLRLSIMLVETLWSSVSSQLVIVSWCNLRGEQQEWVLLGLSSIFWLATIMVKILTICKLSKEHWKKTTFRIYYTSLINSTVVYTQKWNRGKGSLFSDLRIMESTKIKTLRNIRKGKLRMTLGLSKMTSKWLTKMLMLSKNQCRFSLW